MIGEVQVDVVGFGVELPKRTVCCKLVWCPRMYVFHSRLEAVVVRSKHLASYINSQQEMASSENLKAFEVLSFFLLLVCVWIFIWNMTCTLVLE